MVLDEVIAARPGWEGFRDLVAMGSKLTSTMADDPLNHVVQGYHRFRLYAPRMLRILDIQAAPVAQPLLAAVKILRDGGTKVLPVNFLRRRSKWHRLLNAHPDDHSALGDCCPLPLAAGSPLPWRLARLHQAKSYRSSPPIPAKMSWLWPCARLAVSNAPCS